MLELQRVAATVLACLGVSILAAVAPPSARAEVQTCTGSLGAITVDDVRVSQNATCTLTGTRVRGTITVQRNATLIARGVLVHGNVQAERAFAVVVRAWPRFGGSVIFGSVQLKEGGSVSVTRSRISGDLQIESSRRFVRVNDNRVYGSIQIVGNTGGAAIFRNFVVGNLQCKENRPAPTGGANVTGANKEDQCRRL